MFRTAIISFLVASAAMVGVNATREPGACYQDNCQRAVQRTWQGPAVYAQHISQCSSALSCQSTPAASTTTTSTTVTAGVTTIYVSAATNTPAPVAAVLSCPTGIPSDQAQNCENSFVSYSSACSCASVTATTSVAPAPVITATVTTTVPSVVFVTGAPEVVAL
ncbi:hypothetical protein I302_107897 [Kwoniella bestiolae CBS 10118]|uniref:Extracellular membrane protein CFEM domain-containing protein n=1 Tax=Kwoniella bestiolae CBS 10118 TaxID=1296100 RepID=A0A1B9FX92_9TREE|nr:hypothetical protein I302_06361 [Kwoniella bestiolae CBS 10118]OCF23380.1 hypothetical protein I302_06361 [Kwoniella bestiolae CBS 10118]